MQEEFFVTGGTVNVSDADAIQAISGYDAEVCSRGGVSYQISDSVSNLTGSSNSTLTNGNINVTATGAANASDGAILNAFTANIDFDVADTATNLAAEVDPYMGLSMEELDDAASIEVLSGSAVDVDDITMSIQAISGYAGAGDLDIQDDAAVLISAGDAVLNKAGVDIVSTNESNVDAYIGAQLNALLLILNLISDNAENGPCRNKLSK